MFSERGVDAVRGDGVVEVLGSSGLSVTAAGTFYCLFTKAG